MDFILHRVNSVDQLDKMNPAFGAEIDVRSDVSYPGELHLSHDPWKKGDRLSEWLDVYVKRKIQGPLIVNTKEDSLELEIIKLLDKNGIDNYFFLDTTFPTLVKFTHKMMLSRFALRVSEFEKATSTIPFRNKVDWLWIDCFDGTPIPTAELINLKQYFKLCLVSPELQGSRTSQIEQFGNLAGLADSICTKYPNIWTMHFPHLV